MELPLRAVEAKLKVEGQIGKRVEIFFSKELIQPNETHFVLISLHLLLSKTRLHLYLYRRELEYVRRQGHHRV